MDGGHRGNAMGAKYQKETYKVVIIHIVTIHMLKGGGDIGFNTGLVAGTQGVLAVQGLRSKGYRV